MIPVQMHKYGGDDLRMLCRMSSAINWHPSIWGFQCRSCPPADAFQRAPALSSPRPWSTPTGISHVAPRPALLCFLAIMQRRSHLAMIDGAQGGHGRAPSGLLQTEYFRTSELLLPREARVWRSFQPFSLTRCLPTVTTFATRRGSCLAMSLAA
jgi:hypothetical protein